MVITLYTENKVMNRLSAPRSLLVVGTLKFLQFIDDKEEGESAAVVAIFVTQGSEPH